MSEPPATPSTRYVFIDLYRTAVILLMLEGHVVRTFLAPHLQQLSFFQDHEFFHGISAPAFLFGAGLTFVLSSRRRWEEFHRWGPLLSRRIRRLLLILSLGLMLHLPYFSFRKIVMDGSTPDFLRLFQSDVLACIGLGLISLHILVFFFRNERLFYTSVASIILALGFLTPLFWSADLHTKLPLPFAQLLNGSQGSIFPLFPYAGFLFAGVLVSWEFLLATRRGLEGLFILRLAVIGASLVAGGMCFDALPVRVYEHYDFWYTSPNYFLIRCGSLMVILAGFWYIVHTARRYVPDRFLSGSSPLTVLGRESLFVYVLHLIVLYGTAFNPGLNLRSMIGQSLELPSTLVLLGVFVAVMFASTFVWNAVRRRHEVVYRLMQLGAGGAFLVLFFTRDF
jgi:hypothetical protein